MGVLRVMNSSGDAETPFSPTEHKVADEVFASMVEQGFIAFEYPTPGADPIMRRNKEELVFNPDADEVLMVRKLVGG